MYICTELNLPNVLALLYYLSQNFYYLTTLLLKLYFLMCIRILDFLLLVYASRASSSIYYF